MTPRSDADERHDYGLSDSEAARHLARLAEIADQLSPRLPHLAAKLRADHSRICEWAERIDVPAVRGLGLLALSVENKVSAALKDARPD